jgi:hypothetical protein
MDFADCGVGSGGSGVIAQRFDTVVIGDGQAGLATAPEVAIR